MDLTPQQLLFVDALEQGMSLKEAAEYAGVAHVTGKRWWHHDGVRREFDERRHAARDLCTARLQSVALDAVTTLVQLLTCPNPQVARAAADALLKHKYKATEQDDLTAVLRELQERIGSHAGGPEAGSAAPAGDRQEPPPEGQPPLPLP